MEKVPWRSGCMQISLHHFKCLQLQLQVSHGVKPSNTRLRSRYLPACIVPAIIAAQGRPTLDYSICI